MSDKSLCLLFVYLSHCVDPEIKPGLNYYYQHSLIIIISITSIIMTITVMKRVVDNKGGNL